MNVSIAEPDLGSAERENVLSVLDSGHIADGEVVREFEAEFADGCGTDRAVATANGTAALHATLEAIGVEPGSSVVTTPFSFVATANAIRFAGGYPIFADVDPETFNLDPEAVEECIRAADGEIDAIVAVHLYGLPADMDHLRDVADTYDVPLVEDAAQAHSARYRGEPVGSLGDAACFSFYPTKNMTTGEGGMITTDRDDLAEAAARFVDHGRGDDAYEHVELGHNFRMTNIAAAIGRAQLARLPEFVERRRANAAYLTEQLANSGVTTPTEPDGYRHAYHQYTIRADDRDRIRERLAERGVDTAVYYPTPIPDLESYEEIRAETPSARRCAEEVLSLPIHPNVTTEELDAIAEEIRRTTEREVEQ